MFSLMCPTEGTTLSRSSSVRKGLVFLICSKTCLKERGEEGNSKVSHTLLHFLVIALFTERRRNLLLHCHEFGRDIPSKKT